MRGRTSNATKPHLALVPNPRLAPVRRPPPDAEMLYFAEELLRCVLSGEVLGVASVVTLCDGDFFVDAFGQARREPWAQRGYLRSLDDLLAEEGRLLKDAP